MTTLNVRVPRGSVVRISRRGRIRINGPVSRFPASCLAPPYVAPTNFTLALGRTRRSSVQTASFAELSAEQKATKAIYDVLLQKQGGRWAYHVCPVACRENGNGSLGYPIASGMANTQEKAMKLALRQARRNQRYGRTYF